MNYYFEIFYIDDPETKNLNDNISNFLDNNLNKSKDILFIIFTSIHKINNIPKAFQYNSKNFILKKSSQTESGNSNILSFIMYIDIVNEIVVDFKKKFAIDLSSVEELVGKVKYKNETYNILINYVNIYGLFPLCFIVGNLKTINIDYFRNINKEKTIINKFVNKKSNSTIIKNIPSEDFEVISSDKIKDLGHRSTDDSINATSYNQDRIKLILYSLTLFNTHENIDPLYTFFLGNMGFVSLNNDKCFELISTESNIYKISLLNDFKKKDQIINTNFYFCNSGALMFENKNYSNFIQKDNFKEFDKNMEFLFKIDPKTKFNENINITNTPIGLETDIKINLFL